MMLKPQLKETRFLFSRDKPNKTRTTTFLTAGLEKSDNSGSSQKALKKLLKSLSFN